MGIREIGWLMVLFVCLLQFVSSSPLHNTSVSSSANVHENMKPIVRGERGHRHVESFNRHVNPAHEGGRSSGSHDEPDDNNSSKKPAGAAINHHPRHNTGYSNKRSNSTGFIALGSAILVLLSLLPTSLMSAFLV